jgi:hypothetical protein
MSALAHVLEYWSNTNAHAEPGASVEQLAKFENTHDVRLPEAFAELYRRANGNQGDSNLLRFWPLDEIHRLNEDEQLRGSPSALPADATEYFAFADYMIFSHLYASRLTADVRSRNPVLWVMDSERVAEIAPSFEEFLRAYARNPDGILFPAKIPGDGPD